MTTLIVHHEVDDVPHWLNESVRDEVFGHLGITVRAFTDPSGSNKVALLVEVPDIDAFTAFMQSPDAAAAMKADGVRADTVVTLIGA
jgi:hypothetical protein